MYGCIVEATSPISCTATGTVTAVDGTIGPRGIVMSSRVMVMRNHYTGPGSSKSEISTFVRTGSTWARLNETAAPLMTLLSDGLPTLVNVALDGDSLVAIYDNPGPYAYLYSLSTSRDATATSGLYAPAWTLRRAYAPPDAVTFHDVAVLGGVVVLAYRDTVQAGHVVVGAVGGSALPMVSRAGNLNSSSEVLFDGPPNTARWLKPAIGSQG